MSMDYLIKRWSGLGWEIPTGSWNISNVLTNKKPRSTSYFNQDLANILAQDSKQNEQYSE